FNNRRLLEPIGNIPPAEAEAKFYAALDAEPMAAQLTEISLRQTRRRSDTAASMVRNSLIASLICGRSAPHSSSSST
ncbi:hypothetical protein, partial [Cereibacter sphaeroides]|uniref:hypothetical protein n=1 Tax=Cereibacter sphaeroides TaxID=1063 RepID=UPI001F2ACE18